MIGLELDTKKCMSELLLNETFDDFLFVTGEITTFNTFSIDGYLQKDFFDNDALEALSGREYSHWKDIRSFCLSIMKGSRVPLKFKLVFALKPDALKTLLCDNKLAITPEQCQGLYLNLRFENNTLSCITGTALNIFTMDKTLEHAWDEYTKKFLTVHEISYQ